MNRSRDAEWVGNFELENYMGVLGVGPNCEFPHTLVADLTGFVGGWYLLLAGWS